MRKKIICLFFAVFASVLLYGIGYYVGKKLCEDDNYNYKAESVELNPVVSTEQIREVSSTDDIVCKRNMEYVLESINLDTSDIVSVEMDMPVEFLGLNRTQLLSYIAENMTFFEGENEKVKGIMLESFDTNQLVIRKNYVVVEEETTEQVMDNYKYLVKLEDTRLVVYKLEDNSSFLETSIVRESFDSDSISKLSEGIKVTTISEVYRILESFTS